MDLLSNILGLMKLEGSLYFRTSFSAPWGVCVPHYENVARFHYVHRGQCSVRIAEAPEPVNLTQGDLIIIPHGTTHVLSDPSDAPVHTLDQVVAESGFQGKGALVFGAAGSSDETALICGHFAFDTDARHVLLEALPAYIRVQNYGRVSPTWLNDTLNIVADEAGEDTPGSGFIALKLAEVIFAQTIRHYLEHDGRDRPGLAGFVDPHIRRSLQAMHEKPAVPWTVERLARVAGMSRTAFANKFNSLVRSPPLQYLTLWRMQLARSLLADTELPIIDVAEQTGYQSEAAFGRTFKRHFDAGPASYRRARAQL